jgi:hypothetical protein
VSISIKSVSATPDLQLIRTTKDWLKNAEGHGAQVIGRP